MIKAIIFDLDNTLLDFMKMKQFAVKAAITAMNEAGLNIDEDQAYKDIFKLYEFWLQLNKRGQLPNQNVSFIFINIFRRIEFQK